MNIFLTKGYSENGNEVPLLIAYSIRQGTQKELYEYDYRVFGDHSESIIDDVFHQITAREYPIQLSGSTKIDIKFDM